MLAAKLRIIALIAGLSAGTSGKSRRVAGRTSRARLAIRPPFSATRISPRKNAITPTSPIARSTALRADVMIDPVSSSIRPVAAARRTEARATETNRPFSMGGEAASKAAEGDRSRNGGNVRPPAVSNFVRGRPPGAVAAGSRLAFGPAVREP